MKHNLFSEDQLTGRVITISFVKSFQEKQPYKEKSKSKEKKKDWKQERERKRNYD